MIRNMTTVAGLALTMLVVLAMPTQARAQDSLLERLSKIEQNNSQILNRVQTVEAKVDAQSAQISQLAIKVDGLAQAYNRMDAAWPPPVGANVRMGEVCGPGGCGTSVAATSGYGGASVRVAVGQPRRVMAPRLAARRMARW